MTTITPDLNELEHVHLEETRRERPSSFKKIINETNPHPRRRDKRTDRNEDEDKRECVISVFELPRHHFSLPDDEEGLNDLGSGDARGCQPSSAMGGSLPVAALTGPSEGTSKAASSQSIALSAEIEALFEKMAGTMLLLSSSNETETTLFLDTPQFDHSPFYGTRITIKEFSTAPRAFNVEIATSSVALAHLNAHKSALLAAFAKGDFNFSIGRLDTEIQQADRPLFHRKEAVSKDKEEEDLQQ